MRCKSCSEVIEIKCKYCPNCGYKIYKEKSTISNSTLAATGNILLAIGYLFIAASQNSDKDKCGCK